MDEFGTRGAGKVMSIVFQVFEANDTSESKDITIIFCSHQLVLRRTKNGKKHLASIQKPSANIFTRKWREISTPVGFCSTIGSRDGRCVLIHSAAAENGQ